MFVASSWVRYRKLRETFLTAVFTLLEAGYSCTLCSIDNGAEQRRRVHWSHPHTQQQSPLLTECQAWDS